MKREDKDLLIKDLCGHLSHGVKCKILETNEVKILSSIQYDDENTLFDFWEDDQKIQYGYQLYLSEFKPYLFPLSNMTDEQIMQAPIPIQTCDLENLRYDSIWTELNNRFPDLIDLIDWLNKNHFDYRGLIEKGLAIDATGLNIY